MAKTHLPLVFLRQKANPFGGAENYLARLCKELERQGMPFQIRHSKVPQFLPSWLKALWFNREVCSNKKDFYFSLERVTCADIYRAGDGVHKVFLESKKAQNGLSLNPLNPIYLYLEKRCFAHAKHIIANSQYVKQQIIDTYAIPTKKISVIYNGISMPETTSDKTGNKASVLQEELNISCEAKIILYVGSGFKRKGVEEFLAIIAQIKYENIIALVVGKEKKLSHYQQLADKLGIAQKVIFTGARKDVNDFYQLSDIFLFPTHYEPFSNVVLEAASYKNVVFTTEQNGASEVLDADFVMKSPQDLSVVNKLDHLLTDDNLLEQVKEKNYQLAQSFSIQRNVEETLVVIEKFNE